MKNQIQIRSLIGEDIAIISEAFNAIGWNKPASLFKEYLVPPPEFLIFHDF